VLKKQIKGGSDKGGSRGMANPCVGVQKINHCSVYEKSLL